MKKNYFKLAYVTLAVAAMIVVGQQEARADQMDCIDNCASNQQYCYNSCNSSWWTVSYYCRYACYYQTVNCMNACQN
jgi:hypothetical protein